MRMCLFEDRAAPLEPLTLTRPVFDLRCGISRLADKHARCFPCHEIGVFVRPQLADLCQAQHPEWIVNRLDWLREDATVLVNGRWLPPAGRNSGDFRHNHAAIALVDGVVAYAVATRAHLQAATSENILDWLDQWQDSLPQHDAGGRLIDHPWQLIEHNGAEIINDVQYASAAWKRGHATGLSIVGEPDQVWLDASAAIEPHVVANTTAGPVVIDRDAIVHAFTRLEGPCYIGPATHVLGAKIRGGTSIGPECRVGGEIEASILHGYVNKYHDGFLGHSYLGEWVNLGAGTHNSDLRNDYGDVTVTVNGRPIDSGLRKVGCFLGDHTKTGLGTLINTGTNAGVFCNILPAGPLAPKYLPSFTSWWNGALRETSDWSHLLDTARIVMERRGCRLTEEHEMLYRHVFAESAADRRRALRDAEVRHLRGRAA
jgi:UDP-N-acetylglucosamine diphosphorylase/glucosamine-1-phosphate N-acetyltransferase